MANIVVAVSELDAGVRQSLLRGLREAASTDTPVATADSTAPSAGATQELSEPGGAPDVRSAIRGYMAHGSAHGWIDSSVLSSASDDEALTTILIARAANGLGVNSGVAPGQAAHAVASAWWSKNQSKLAVPPLGSPVAAQELASIVDRSLDQQQQGRVARVRRYRAGSLVLGLGGALLGLIVAVSLYRSGADLFVTLVAGVLLLVGSLVGFLVLRRKGNRLHVFDDRYAALLICMAFLGAPRRFTTDESALPGRGWDQFLAERRWDAASIAAARDAESLCHRAFSTAQEEWHYWSELDSRGPQMLSECTAHVGDLERDGTNLQADLTAAERALRVAAENQTRAGSVVRDAAAPSASEQMRRSQREIAAAATTREREEAARLETSLTQAQQSDSEQNPSREEQIRALTSQLDGVRIRLAGAESELKGIDADLKSYDDARRGAVDRAKADLKMAEDEYGRAEKTEKSVKDLVHQNSSSLSSARDRESKLRTDLPRVASMLPASETTLAECRSKWEGWGAHIRRILEGRHSALVDSWATAFPRVTVNPAVMSHLSPAIDEGSRLALERVLGELNMATAPSSLGRPGQQQDSRRVGAQMPDRSVWELEYAVQKAGDGWRSGVFAIAPPQSKPRGVVQGRHGSAPTGQATPTTVAAPAAAHAVQVVEPAKKRRTSWIVALVVVALVGACGTGFYALRQQGAQANREQGSIDNLRMMYSEVEWSNEATYGKQGSVAQFNSLITGTVGNRQYLVDDLGKGLATDRAQVAAVKEIWVAPEYASEKARMVRLLELIVQRGELMSEAARIAVQLEDPVGQSSQYSAILEEAKKCDREYQALYGPPRVP